MDNVEKIVEGFLAYLKETGQEELLPEVVELLSREVLAETRRVTVVSAVPLTTNQLEEIGEILAEKFGQHLVVETEVDPGLLGGLKLKYEDKLIDLSVIGRLRETEKKIVSS
jgi:ATP synthase F1 delta subunit